MSEFVSLKVIGLKEAVKFSRGMAERMEDQRPVLGGPIDKSVRAMFYRQFQSEGKLGGKPWRQLSPFTLAMKARSNRADMGILRFTNTLWASLVKRRSRGTLLVIGKDEYRRGTVIPYAAKHQDPEAFGLTRLPQREIVPPTIPMSFTNRWQGAIRTFVIDGRFVG